MAKNPKTNKSKRNPRKIINSIIVVFLCLILVGSVSGFFILSKIVAKVQLTDEELVEKIVNSSPTEVYSADGKKIGELGAESRELITYDQLPQVTIDAFLAIEDSRFFTHNGFDLPRFISSAFSNLRTGSLAQGGSTLTMQTIDNFLIKPQEEKDEQAGIRYSPLEKIEHKIQEIYLSMRLDHLESKEDILVAYLNKINFGSSMNTRGIQKAAEYYFGKDVEQLNLSESAFLAGVVNAPALYNPYKGYSKEYQTNYYKAATQRRNETLSMMLMHGYITENEYNLAKSTKLAFQVNGEPSETETSSYQYYITQAAEEARKLTGVDPATTSMKIYTALDRDVQDQMNKIADKESGIAMPNNPYYQIASVVMNNQTGEVVAINDGFNESMASYRSRSMVDTHAPGSTMKPILEYALSFENCGWATSRVMNDRKFDVNGHVIVNYDMKYHGKVSLERAIAQSLNVPAVETMLTVEDTMGANSIIDYLKSLGFKDEVAEKYDYQYAIGANNMEATPLEMAAAYSAFANGGTYIQPHLVTKVEFSDGSKVIENNPKQTQVLSPQASYMVNDLLYKAVNGKYNSYNYMGGVFAGAGYPVYGKSGTSDWDDSVAQYIGGKAKDSWMVNYTSQYTVASWNGFDGRVDGYSYLSTDIQNMNVPGRINRMILDMLSNGAYKIQRPDGLSSYGGGLIKTEYLKDAAKNNPETENNMKDYHKELEKVIDNYLKYDASKYSEETWKAFSSVLEEAKKALDNKDLTDEELKELISKLDKASKELKEKEVVVDVSSLNNAIKEAQLYLDTSKYDANAVANLMKAVNDASTIAAKEGVTQQEIDAAVANINSMITICKNSPVNTPPGSTTENGNNVTVPPTPSN